MSIILDREVIRSIVSQHGASLDDYESRLGLRIVGLATHATRMTAPVAAKHVAAVPFPPDIDEQVVRAYFAGLPDTDANRGIRTLAATTINALEHYRQGPRCCGKDKGIRRMLGKLALLKAEHEKSVLNDQAQSTTMPQMEA